MAVLYNIHDQAIRTQDVRMGTTKKVPLAGFYRQEFLAGLKGMDKNLRGALDPG